MAIHKVVIVGGGFGGTKAALMLARDHHLDVTLVYDHPDFRYYPAMYQTATGSSKTVSSIPIKDLFHRLPITLIQDSLTDIDRHAQTIKTESGKSLHYDALILALGVQTNYFHIEGLPEFSFGIKTIEDAEKFKLHLHQQLIDTGKPDLNYVIVGGGPTGIELAGVLPAYIKKISKHHGIKSNNFHIDLVEAAPRLLPRSPRDISNRVTRHLKRLGIKLYLKTAVKAETVDSLMVNDKPIRSHTVIWTAGMTNHPFFATHGFQISSKGKVRVDQYMQAEPGIYVIGDNADSPYSGMAQTAIRDGIFVAQNISLLASGQDPKPYVAKKPIYVFAAGTNWSAVQWGPVHLFGKVGALVRRLADLIGYHDYEPWKIATERLMSEKDSEEACPICGTSTNNETVL